MTMPLRIMVVGLLPPRPGGASVSLGQLLSGLSGAGVEIAAIAPITASSMLGEGDLYAARNPRMRIYRYLMNAYVTETYRLLPSEMARSERRQIMLLGKEIGRTFQPDLLIAGHETTGGYVRELAEDMDLPWCQLLRGSPTGQILTGRFPAERTSIFIEQFRAADLIIAVAEFMATGLERQFGIADICTIANAIDLDLFQPRTKTPSLLRNFGLPADRPIILCPANLIARKRPMDILEAFRIIVNSHDEVVLIFAGEGRLEDEMRTFLETYGLTDRASLLGWVRSAEMPALINCADVVVMASESEGMSRACIEALACGKTLVASDIPSSRELIEDGVSGRLFPLGDYEALAATLLELLSDSARRAELGAAGRRRIAERRIGLAVNAYLTELESLRDRHRNETARTRS
jgi:glycosyltransferase involved in cell wall biosynthesis